MGVASPTTQPTPDRGRPIRNQHGIRSRGRAVRLQPKAVPTQNGDPPLESRQDLFMPLKELELGIVDRSGEHICGDAVLHHTDGLALEAAGCAIRAFDANTRIPLAKRIV